jgi:dihydrofolate reductase
MSGVLSVVISSIKYGKREGYEYVATPEAAFALASSRAYKEVVLVGGAKANAAMLSAGLVDEMILDVHPFYLGEGIGVFGDSGLAPSLELISSTTPGDSLVQLHYKVKK